MERDALQHMQRLGTKIGFVDVVEMYHVII